MTTILTRLRTHARANSGQFQVCLSIQEVREIVRALGEAESLSQDNDRLREALPFNSRRAAESIAQMVVEWVDGAFADWRPGLANVLEARLDRLITEARSAALAPLSSPAEVAYFIDSMDGGTKRIE